MAIATILAFHCYLVESLVPTQVVSALDPLGSGRPKIGLVLAPMELRKPSKTGHWDEAVLSDRCDALIRPLLTLKRKAVAEGAPLFSFRKGMVTPAIRLAGEKSGLSEFNISAYSLRNGGASHDLLCQMRPLQKVKRCGRWASDSEALPQGDSAHRGHAASASVDSAAGRELAGSIGLGARRSHAGQCRRLQKLMRRAPRAPVFQAAVSRQPARFSAVTLGTSENAGAAETHRLLRKTFKAALPRVTFAPRIVFLELFSGKGQISAAIRRAGGAAVRLDRRESPFFDIVSASISDHVQGWISGGCANGVWIAFPRRWPTIRASLHK